MKTQSSDPAKPDGDSSPQAAAKQPWEPMQLKEEGDIESLIAGGGGKLSVSGADPGDSRKPAGSV